MNNELNLLDSNGKFLPCWDRFDMYAFEGGDFSDRRPDESIGEFATRIAQKALDEFNGTLMPDDPKILFKTEEDLTYFVMRWS